MWHAIIGSALVGLPGVPASEHRRDRRGLVLGLDGVDLVADQVVVGGALDPTEDADRRLAQDAGLDRVGQDLAFMAGMLSRLDVLFGQPLPELLRPLAIGDDLRDALLAPDQTAHPVGALLRTWQAVEARALDNVTRHWPAWGMEGPRFQACILAACHWTLDLIGAGAGRERCAG